MRRTVRKRTDPYGPCYSQPMTTIKANDVRIPRHAREALAHHEEVVVINRERAVFILVNADDHVRRHREATPRGRPLAEALALLEAAPPPDPEFARDMEAVIRSVGPQPESPWQRS